MAVARKVEGFALERVGLKKDRFSIVLTLLALAVERCSFQRLVVVYVTGSGHGISVYVTGTDANLRSGGLSRRMGKIVAGGPAAGPWAYCESEALSRK
jgi:hypothetical protein